MLRRGQALTAENQRANTAIAADALARIAMDHQLIVTHGNGPQVGLLALQGNAYKPDEAYPLDVLGAETEGMIGYMIEQELGNRLPQETPLATLCSPRSLSTGTTRHLPTRQSLSARSMKRPKLSGWLRKRVGTSVQMVISGVGSWRPPCRNESFRSGRSTG